MCSNPSRNFSPSGIFHWALMLFLSVPLVAAAADANYDARVLHILQETPLIDGHNDLAWEIRERFNSRLSAVDLQADTSKLLSPTGVPLMTDIPRLRAGRVGGQFWSVWIPPQMRGFEAVQMTLEQIDLVKRIAARYPAIWQWRTPLRISDGCITPARSPASSASKGAIRSMTRWPCCVRCTPRARAI